MTVIEATSYYSRNKRKQLNNMPIKTIISIVIAVILLGGGLSFCSVETIRGNEMGVMEDWKLGVMPQALPTKMYFINRYTQSIYHYDMSSQIFVMNDMTHGEKGKGRDKDAYLVQSSDRQDMHVNLNVRWRIDPTRLVSLHTTYHAYMGTREEDILEEKLIRPAIMFIVKNHVTKMKAMDAYSGDGLVALQAGIEKELANPEGDLRHQGIIVDNFVIEKIGLDPNYTLEIKASQIAQQKKIRADEETKAADAEALKAKAVAQSDLNRAVVEAERDKQVAILKAQQLAAAQVEAAKASKEQTVLAAEASAQQVKLAANAEKEAAEARASAIKALGEANAAAKKLEFSSYSAPGAEIYAQIQIAQSMGNSFSGIQGYLPQGMNINLLSDNFLSAVRSVMSPTNRTTTTSTTVPAPLPAR